MCLTRTIPRKLKGNETLVRTILHPFYYSVSRNKLKREAFLPPPEKDDVSVLRLKYTNPNFCKKHSKEIVINNHNYCGLALVKIKRVYDANDNNNYTFHSGEILSVSVKATPLDINKSIVEAGKITVKDKGVPMHADILYSSKCVDGEPKTLIRKIAEFIVNGAQYFNDPNPSQEDWKGEKLVYRA